MFRACELKDQTYKKTRTLHFSETAKIDSKSAPLERVALGAWRSGEAGLWLEGGPQQ